MLDDQDMNDEARSLLASDQQRQQPDGLQPQQPIQIDFETLLLRTYQAYQLRLTNDAAAKYGGDTQMLQPQEVQRIKMQAMAVAQLAIRQQHAAMGTRATPQMQMQTQQQMHTPQMQQERQTQQMQQIKLQTEYKQQLRAGQQHQQRQQRGGSMPLGMISMQNMQGNQSHSNMTQQQQAHYTQHEQRKAWEEQGMMAGTQAQSHARNRDRPTPKYTFELDLN